MSTAFPPEIPEHFWRVVGVRQDWVVYILCEDGDLAGVLDRRLDPVRLWNDRAWSALSPYDEPFYNVWI